MNFLPEILLLILVLSPAVARAEPIAPIQQKAVDFQRFELDDNPKVEWIRKSGNLSGITDASPDKQPRVTGWVEYDFSVAKAGWYRLSVQPDGRGHQFLVDGKNLFYGAGQSATNLWLGAGPHTLRIQRWIYTGFGKITGWKLTPAGQDPAERISLRTTNPWKVIRQGEFLPVTVSFGELTAPVKLSLLVSERGKPGMTQTIPVNLPAGGGLQETMVEIPGSKQGIYEIGFQVGDSPPANQPPILFAVVDTTPVAPKEGEVVKRLVAEIDVVNKEPDFFKGGATRVINKPWGSYRESGDVGYLQRMNATDPSWFAYKFAVEDPDALYWMEFDFPDDARRSFVVVPRSGHPMEGPFIYAGPGSGPDTGREFSLTNQMQTMGIYFWPHDTDLRAVVMQPQSGLRAAVSKIRIYKVEGDFSPLPHANGGRDFIHWNEEGVAFMNVFGAPDTTRPESVILAADNWARIMSYMGASVLMPTPAIYQMKMYPSAFNPEFSDSNTFDAVRVIELVCEKFGLGFISEFHPEARSLKRASAQEKSPDSIFQFDRLGKIQEGPRGPKFNFLHPAVEKFAVGMVGEFVDRYGDSPAFEGVSIRLMFWQNSGFGNFQDLSWGYGDFTIGLFERESGTKIPVPADDPERFEKRYEWLMANAKEAWIDWRCRKAAEFFAKVAARLRENHPEARLFLNSFIRADSKTSATFYDSFLDAPREAGIDPEMLASVPGVELLTSTLMYGRRSTEEINQRLRDALLNPAFLGVLNQDGKAPRFMTSQAYFEATVAVAPPKDMGYPVKTRHGWMSGTVNPAGRHYLERFALALAESDAASLGDGGNAYTVGQPLLREFLREYRALPKENFQARPDARDPVAVWERAGEKDFLFYAVNRERYPVKVQIQFAAVPAIKRLATKEDVPVNGTELQIELQPYELRTFAAEAGTRIEQITETIPEADLERVREMTSWLRLLAEDVTSGKVGESLTPAQKSLLSKAAAEAETSLHAGHTWRARTLQEDQRLREIYSKCGRIPPLLDQNGPALIPENAFSGNDLLLKATSKNAELIASETVSPDWTGQQIIVASAGEMAFTIQVPVDGKYQILFGQAVGDRFSDSTIKVDGKEVGLLKSSPGSPRIHPSMVSTPIHLLKGKHQISLLPKDGRPQGLLFLQLLPVYQDIVANRWMIAGPFLASAATGKLADAAIEGAMKNKAFAPEVSRDFSATLETFDKPRKWQHQGGQEDFVNFKKATGQGLGSIHYAVTHITSPVERDVEVSYSSDYHSKIWLNGEVVRDYYSPGGHPEKGQLKLTLHLKKGTNEVLLKVGAGSENNGFWMAVNNPGDLKFFPMMKTEPSESNTHL